MVKKKNTRLTNIELLRIVAMLMIIIYHIVLHCINIQLTGGDSIIKIWSKLYNYPIFYKELFILNGIMTWGAVGNAIFLLISGYFMVNSKKEIDIIKISKKLLLQLGFASILLVVFSKIIYDLNFIEEFIQLIDINSFNSMSWYVGYYFLVILIAHFFLNKYLKKINKKQYITFLIIIFALTQFSWTNQIMNGFSNGISTLLTGVFFYSFGGYIDKYNPFKNVRFISILLIILMINLLIYISFYNITAIKIDNYFIKPTYNFTQNIMSFGNSNILVVILSICIFEMFTRIKMENINYINYIASGTFIVYLIHDNALFYSIWGIIDWIPILYNSPIQFIITLLGIGLSTFMVGIIAYLLYNLTTKMCLKYKKLFLKN